jgi:hypothetical protein
MIITIKTSRGVLQLKNDTLGNAEVKFTERTRDAEPIVVGDVDTKELLEASKSMHSLAKETK